MICFSHAFRVATAMSHADTELSLVRTQVQTLIRFFGLQPVQISETRLIGQEGILRLESQRLVHVADGSHSSAPRVRYENGSSYGAILLPQTDDGYLQFVLRYRPAVCRWSLELPRSSAPDDDGGWRTAADDELFQATGLTCEKMTLLGSVNVDPAHLAAVTLIVLATNCRLKQSPQWVPKELIAGTINVHRNWISQLIVSGDIECGLTLAALSIYLARQSLARRDG
jgi:hypothetical protein